MNAETGINPLSIPQWNTRGVIPPVHPYAHGGSPNRSPYPSDFSMFVDRFASTHARIRILEGLLRYREEIAGAGIVSGFQWLNGSFLENVEVLENRPPRDMDVVTFFNLPEGIDQTSFCRQNPALFDQKRLKQCCFVDAYHVVLGTPLSDWNIKNIAYWYSMWSHRRDGLWKGFIQVALDQKEDATARNILSMYGGNQDAPSL